MTYVKQLLRKLLWLAIESITPPPDINVHITMLNASCQNWNRNKAKLVNSEKYLQWVDRHDNMNIKMEPKFKIPNKTRNLLLRLCYMWRNIPKLERQSLPQSAMLCILPQSLNILTLYPRFLGNILSRFKHELWKIKEKEEEELMVKMMQCAILSTVLGQTMWGAFPAYFFSLTYFCPSNPYFQMWIMHACMYNSFFVTLKIGRHLLQKKSIRAL